VVTLTALAGQTGLNAFQDGKSIAVQSLKDHLGEDNIKRLINYILRYLSEAPSPPRRVVLSVILLSAMSAEIG